MIVCKIHGGTGNQMFQYATGVSVSKRNNQEVFFIWNSNRNDEPRQYSLNNFKNIDNELYQYDGSTQFRTIEDDFNYKEIKIDSDENVYLNGYWQSERYFSEYRDEILRRFEPSDNFKFDVKENSVSLHVRRTDYLKSNGYHPVQSVEYYEKALAEIGSYNEILVFSDDIEWCKENFKFEKMRFVQNQLDIEDIWSMSLCDHNIIANSSFSWWGAWLNNNPNKKVIAPKMWFGDHVNLSTEDLIPSNWILL